jgi:hypothetical protein
MPIVMPMSSTGVVRVDLEVALGLHREVEGTVARELVEHVVEERDAGGEARLAAAVEVERHEDLGLLGVALDFGLAHDEFRGLRRGPRGVGHFLRRCRP